jgi:hypothetical protein
VNQQPDATPSIYDVESQFNGLFLQGFWPISHEFPWALTIFLDSTSHEKIWLV